MDKVLKITGTARMSVQPDRTRMRLAVRKIDEDYSEAKDSRHKAEVIAQAGNIGLGDIVTIDYSWSQLVVRSQEQTISMPDYINPKALYMTPDITPVDISMTDTITVVWAIR